MKKVEIVGKNYFGHWDACRVACRAVVLRDGKILVSYETRTGQLMIPGGGKEQGEHEAECCVREVAEETGLLIKVSECMLEIDEYYENMKLVSLYFLGEVAGSAQMKLTRREREVGMEPRWFSLDEALSVFSEHERYSETDEMRRGLYLREYTALCEMLGK